MMPGLTVDNCPRCGAIFNKNLRNLCPNCMKQMDDMLEVCESYLLRHDKATTEQLQQATGVPMDVIMKFIKEERKLSTKFYPNLTYPCEKCGRGIREARICAKCGTELLEAFRPARPAEPIPQPSADSVSGIVFTNNGDCPLQRGSFSCRIRRQLQEV
ncbi:hypothetical protein [Gordoniibacillus kamchatkensis]|uniref:hypothetical protein n=1 Tax=Gordoniibacillus kamchatkensis TaxID=1590651 RepID=UPI0006962E08|nr:hypothetical protein [Paenibacillus sp. VKM B-2647]